MYLSDEKRAGLRACFENQYSNSINNSKKNKNNSMKRYRDTEDVRKISQILFDVRDGKEVFTPF